MGIDPGTMITGVGIIDINERGQINLCHFTSIRTNRKHSLSERLLTIFNGLTRIIEEFNPDQVAVEDIFYSDNVKTAMVLGHARGVALLAPVMRGIKPAEYAPREVKLAVVGRGGATKSQVQFMVKNILKQKDEIKPADAADALAVAICHHQRFKALPEA